MEAYQIVDALGLLALSLGFTLSDERAAALSRVLHRLEMIPSELERVASRLLYDETLAKTLRFGRGITPLDFKRVLDQERDAAERRRNLQRQLEAQARADQERKTRGIKSYTQVDAPRLHGKKENLRRLEAGSPSLDHKSQEWHQEWKDYFKRSYVTDAQEKVREQLEHYAADDPHGSGAESSMSR